MWSACTERCGGGQKTRHRGVLTPAAHSGAPCAAGAARQVVECNTAACGLFEVTQGARAAHLGRCRCGAEDTSQNYAESK